TSPGGKRLGFAQCSRVRAAGTGRTSEGRHKPRMVQGAGPKLPVTVSSGPAALESTGGAAASAEAAGPARPREAPACPGSQAGTGPRAWKTGKPDGQGLE